MLDLNDAKQTATWIAAAERYFVDLGDVRPLFDKPFVPLEHAGYHVARVGYLLHHLEHEHGHTVLDFGAGMCWLSVILARSGSQVIAVDVSPTALQYGAEVIRRADLLPGTPVPRLVTYDGWRLPLQDASVDRIACFDALHHVPNKRAVLQEMSVTLAVTLPPAVDAAALRFDLVDELITWFEERGSEVAVVESSALDGGA